MSSEIPYRLACQSLLAAFVSCAAFAVGCGGASDASDDAAVAGASAGSGSNPGAAGRAAGAGSGSFGNAGGGSFGGTVGAAGQFTGPGGSASSAGSGGNIQVAGAGGRMGGSGGTFAAGGASGGAGGAKMGAGGTVGHAGQSSGGAGGTGSKTPTWTQIYTTLLTNTTYASNCNGAACHNPGKQKGYDFSTQAIGYTSVKKNTSQVVSELSSGGMPKGKTKMPAADLALIKAWVAAGALNN